MSRENPITWTRSLRVDMYVLFQDAVDGLTLGSRGKPVAWSKAKYHEVLDSIATKLGISGSGHAGALSNQIAWLYCTPSARCHRGHHNNRNKNLLAAQLAGFLPITERKGFESDVGPEPAEDLSDTKFEAETLNIFQRLWNKAKSMFS